MAVLDRPEEGQGMVQVSRHTAYSFFTNVCDDINCTNHMNRLLEICGQAHVPALNEGRRSIPQRLWQHS